MNDLRKEEQELQKQARANKCLSGKPCRDLAWKTEAE